MLKHLSVDSLEQKEIRGLNLKTVIAIFISMFSVIATILKTYYSLKEDITNVIKAKENDDKFLNYRLQQMEAREAANDSRIIELEKELQFKK